MHMTKQDKVEEIKKLSSEIAAIANYIILIGDEREVLARRPLEIMNEAILHYIDKQNCQTDDVELI